MIQEQKPYCNFTLNALSRASGLAQMTRVPSGGSVKFDSCSIVMDGAKITSKTCFQVLCPVPMCQETLLRSGTRHSRTGMIPPAPSIQRLLMSQARLPSECFASSLPSRPFARTTIAADVPWQPP